MRKHILRQILLLTNLIFFVVFCFGQKPSKDIFEKLKTQTGGCDFVYNLSNIEIHGLEIEQPLQFNESENMILTPTDAVSNYQHVADSIKMMLENFKKCLPSNSDFYHQEKLSNGNFLLRENNKWNLKNSKGMPINELLFDYISSDTFALGFVGYKNGRANYYDGNTGKPLFKNEYLHVEISGKKEFIVQDINGYGILKNDKVIVKPSMYSIFVHQVENRKRYKLYDARNRKYYILLDDMKTILPKESNTSGRYLGNDFYLSSSNLWNLKTRKKLICTEENALTFLSEKYERLSVRVAGEYVNWLIDLQGNFVSKIPFKTISPFNEDGYAIAELSDNPGQYNSKSYKGVINTVGEWVVQPKYHFIFKIKNYWRVINYHERTQALFDSNGKEIIPLGKESISYWKDDIFMIGTGENGEGISKLVNVKTSETIKENIPYLSIHHSILDCDPPLYVLNKGTKQILVDENFKAITEPHLNIYYQYGYIKFRDTRPEPVYNELFRMDCSRKIIPFDIKEKQIKKYRNWLKITEDLDFMEDLDGNKYFIYKDGKVTPTTFKFSMHWNKKQLKYFAGMHIRGSYNEGYGMFKENGETVIPMGFLKGIYPAQLNDGRQTTINFSNQRSAILTAKGELVSGQIFKYTQWVATGVYIVTTFDDQKGVINQYGEWVIPIGSDVSNTGAILKVKDEEKERWYDLNGNRIK